MKKLMRFFKNEDGLESVEYAVLGSLIIIAIIATVMALGTSISATFQTIIDAL